MIQHFINQLILTSRTILGPIIPKILCPACTVLPPRSSGERPIIGA